MQYDFTIYSDDAILRLIQLLIYKDPTSSKLSPIATTTSMRFTVTVAALLAALATTCFAQGVIIGSPTNGTSVSLGSNIVVQVVREDTLTSSTELGIVIGLFSCTTTNSVCLPPGDALGTILYKGTFNPHFPSPPQENFTVTIPSTFAPGPAELSVFHAALVGADNMALAETVAITLNVTT